MTVRLLGLPLALYREASEHNDELMREFALILAARSLDAGSAPARLLRLSEDLRARFGAFGAQPTAELGAALSRGDERLDLTYAVPVEAREASLRLGQVLDEADAYCYAGDHLLTLATPPGALCFRRWFLAEFVAQIDGRGPTPWDESPFAGAARRLVELANRRRASPAP